MKLDEHLNVRLVEYWNCDQKSKCRKCEKYLKFELLYQLDQFKNLTCVIGNFRNSRPRSEKKWWFFDKKIIKKVMKKFIKELEKIIKNCKKSYKKIV